MVKRRTRDRRTRVRVPAGAFCADSYFGVHSTPVLPQQGVKDSCRSAKSACGCIQLKTHAPFTYVALNDNVNWCMVVWFTKNVLRSATATVPRGNSHVTTKQRCKYTTSVDIKTAHEKTTVTDSESHATRAQ